MSPVFRGARRLARHVPQRTIILIGNVKACLSSTRLSSILVGILPTRLPNTGRAIGRNPSALSDHAFSTQTLNGEQGRQCRLSPSGPTMALISRAVRDY